MDTNIPAWDEYFMSIAQAVSTRSKDPRTKVGAVLVSQDNRIIGTGYNGFKPGSVETPDLWDRPTKYEHVVHAEQNAVDFSFDLASKGQVKLYTTLFPCKNCMAILLNYQICEIIYKESYKDTSESMEMALNVGIKVTLL